jgi:low temperature requirement protein LtrA
MIAGIVLGALGVKKTLGDVGVELDTVTAFAMLGGASLYLLGHVGHRFRNVGTVNNHRLVAAVLCLALLPVAVQVPALATLAILTVVLWALIGLEAIRFVGSRQRAREALAD